MRNNGIICLTASCLTFIRLKPVSSDYKLIFGPKFPVFDL